MSTSQLTISKQIQTEDDLDFDFLRKKGIEYIEQLSGKIWTDYNTHDPGITILELLSYAITDLGLRVNMPIEDILNGNQAEKQFFEAHEILPNSALTTLDYRKLFLDTDPSLINNCFLKPYRKPLFVNCRDVSVSTLKRSLSTVPKELQKEIQMKGLYTLWVDFASDDKTENDQLKEKLLQVYHANRNLCEDLVEIKTFNHQKIKLCADIEIHPQADENLILAKILQAVSKYFSPKTSFYSLKEMLDKGYATEEIFEGPLLNHGFVIDEELESNQLRSVIHLSDLMNLILSIPGVVLLHDLSMEICTEKDESEAPVFERIEKEDPWVLCLKENVSPKLCDNQSTFTFRKEELPIDIDQQAVQNHRDNLWEDHLLSLYRKSVNNTLVLPEGKNLALSSYSSISHDFPENYGIGRNGLSDKEAPLRHAQAKQLKAYLLFFDQILAIYFKHLEQVKTQLSLSAKLTSSYFFQQVEDFPGIQALIQQDENPNQLKDLLSRFDDQDARNSKIKDHLIARFAENFGNYAFLMQSIYGKAAVEMVHRNKEAFLQNYDSMSSRRGAAFTYYKQPAHQLWDSTNVSGFENRIAGLLGIKLKNTKSYQRESLSSKHVEIYQSSSHYRWRIRNNENQILLSSTENYETFEAAEEELYHCVFTLVNCDRTALEKLKNGNFNRKTVQAIEIIKSPSKRFSFNIINPDIRAVSDPDRILARQYRFYTTFEKLKETLLETYDFFMEEFCDEGIHLLEHILLLPEGENQQKPEFYLPICAADCASTCSADPYSFRLSIVLPGYTQRFSDPNFRKFAEDLIRKELPAHIVAKICWVGHRKNTVPDSKNDLYQFETNLKKFLWDKSTGSQESIPELIQSMKNLNSYYKPGKLQSCDKMDPDKKFIIGRTTI